MTSRTVCTISTAVMFEYSGKSVGNFANYQIFSVPQNYANYTHQFALTKIQLDHPYSILPENYSFNSDDITFAELTFIG